MATLEEIVLAEIPQEKLSFLTKEELIILLKGEQSIRRQLERKLSRAEALHELLKQRSLLLEEQYVTIKSKVYGKSSEKAPRRDGEDSSLNPSEDGNQEKKKQKKRILLPSERYPDAPLVEQHITLDQPPACSCCQSQMEDSGLTEDSEYLTVIPKQYVVIRQCRHKYRCKRCYGDLKTAPLPPRIKPGSALSDELIVDAAMSKYCDLIPMDRYSKIASRAGIPDLPPQSLIEATHNLADFLRPVYEKLKAEILAVPWLHADETPHRMLEGDKKSNWFLWGFSSQKTSYFECHDTRSGDVAGDLLTQAACEVLVSDVYSGYSKAVRIANESRKLGNRPLIRHSYCNAHSRRYFRQAGEKHPQESIFYVEKYQEIYRLEEQVNSLSSAEEVLMLRGQMRPHFAAIKARALSELASYSDKSKLGKAMSYFLKNEEGLTRFLTDSRLPIDNNPQERLLRNPVVGRKTWYGTHSKRGAETAAILFSLVESCKLNKINPRLYFKQLVEDLHAGKASYTPAQFQFN